MKIALIGYGKMGKAIEAIAIERGHTTDLKITSQNTNYTSSDLAGHDVAIEFSRPDAARANFEKCLEAGVPVVTGTTGWYHDYEAISQAFKKQQGALFHATNFSIGVNLFFEVNRKLAALMNQQPQYDVELREIHHVHKLDSPSGTAISLAEQVIHEVDRKQSWSEEAISPNQISIVAERESEVPGTHILTWDSDIDTLQISHEAKNRKGFALGAVLAAEWLPGKTGIFTMKDLLNL